MVRDPSRWQCRQCDTTHEGFAFPYRRCPHCGGELTLIDDGDPAGETPAGLRMAVEIELGGRAFYQRAAADAADAEMRALFRRFAVMEGGHMETLALRYGVHAGGPAAPLRVEHAAVFGGVEHRPQDPDNLFRIAIALEQRAAEFFAGRAALAPPDSPEQRLYLELAAEEREHATTLSAEHARWRRRQPLRVGATPADAAPASAAGARVNAAEVLLADADPAHVALECGDQRLTYAELRERVARAAGAWRARGLQPGHRVAIKLPDGIDWVVAFLGTIWAGGVAVAVNPHVPAPEWQYILDEAGFDVIVAEHADDTPPPWRDRVVLLDEGRRLVADAAAIEPLQVDPDTPAFWCHSSGTSGKPKAVVHGHRFAHDIARVSRERIGIGRGDRLFATSRLFFAYAQTNSLFAGLRLGATVLLDPQWPTAASVAAAVDRLRPTVLFSVPSLYRNLLHEGFARGIADAGVTRCVSAGEALPPALRNAWRSVTGLGMVDGYGASEVLVLVLTALDGDDGLQPSPGVDVRPLDAEAAAGDAPTRLAFRVSMLALGYLDRPAAQAESFRDGWFCPADLFVRTPSGGWRFAGREDALVKIKGRWVNLVELDERLGTGLPGLLEAASVCVPDADGVDTIAFFYVVGNGDGFDVDRALRERIAALPAHQRPSALHAIDTLPRTATGKLLRRKLAERLK